MYSDYFELILSVSRYYASGRYPNIRAGRKRIPFINARKAFVTIPTARKGIDNNQTTGHKINAIMARGQQKMDNIKNPIITSNIFIDIPFYLRAESYLYNHSANADEDQQEMFQNS